MPWPKANRHSRESYVPSAEMATLAAGQLVIFAVFNYYRDTYDPAQD